MQKIKVMFVVIQLDAGGSERVVLDLASGLDSCKYEVYIASFKGGVLEDPFRKICKKIIFIKKGRGFDIFAMIKVSKIIKKYEIDVVNAHHFMPCFYSFLGTCIFNFKRFVYTEHSCPEVESIAKSFYGKIFNWMLYRASAVIGVSNEITGKFREYYPNHLKKFYAISNGVDINKFARKQTRETIRCKFGLNNDQFVIGTVANFRKVKNHACLLRAAARLKNSYPKLRLLLIGTGYPTDPDNTEMQILKLIDDFELREVVIMGGYQENIPDILSALDLFCLPSFSEGLPISLLEAMAAGLPIVGSKVNGIVEVIENRKTGVLFPSNEDEELSIAIAEFIDNPKFCRLIGENGLNFVKKYHNNRIWIQKYSEILRGQLLKKK